MEFSLEGTVSVLTVFVQGLLSFFSPCVLPLVPVYLSYLAGGAKNTLDDGSVRYQRGKVLLRTVFFVLGISFSFFVMGFGVSALGSFFSDNRLLFARIGGVVVILFGLYQLGLFGASRLLGQERRLPLHLDKLAMNPFTAFLLGFIFSFAWTPCVGPALASVLLIAASSTSSAYGFFLIFIYTLGFILPFLAVGLFTGTLLELFRRHRKALAYTVKVGGALLVLMGIMMVTGWMNGFTGYLSAPSVPPAGGTPASSSAPDSDASLSGSTGSSSLASAASNGEGGDSSSPASTASNGEAGDSSSLASAASNSEGGDSSSPPEKVPAPDFTLTDQFGNTHTLSDYKGQIVFLNFWATWCGPCQDEMPDLQSLYEDLGENAGEVAVLGVARPNDNQTPGDREKTSQGITGYLNDHGYTYPTVLDVSGEVFWNYGITAFPTTFLIDAEGNLLGYLRGGLTRDIMDSVIQQAKDAAV